jgi:hypothetical protein
MSEAGPATHGTAVPELVPPLPYSDAREHLGDELLWLGLLVLRAVIVFRLAHPAAREGLQGVYIADARIDEVLTTLLGEVQAPSAETDRIHLIGRRGDEARAHIGHRLQVTPEATVDLPLLQLAQRFGLDATDQAILVIAAAPDLDARFETLYAYLQDDISRRRPTIGLVATLLRWRRDDTWVARLRFSAAWPLMREGLIVIDQESPTLSRSMWVPDRILDDLVACRTGADRRLAAHVDLPAAPGRWADVVLDAATLDRLRAVTRLWQVSSLPLVLLEGTDGNLGLRAARALAADLGRPIVELRLASLIQDREPATAIVRLLRREMILRGALLAVCCAHLLAGEGERTAEVRGALQSLFEDPPGPVVMTAEGNVQTNLTGSARLVRIPLPGPDEALRSVLWSEGLAAAGGTASEESLRRVSAKFVLAGGQIADAARTAIDLVRLRGGTEATSSDLHAAARDQSHHRLGTLARKVDRARGWDDIVLPPSTLRHLREIAVAAEQWRPVTTSWGFARRMPRGRGLSVLFSGASGTGKTMAAEIIAGELELDLYAVNLATIMSKYIGETPKNLSQIFGEAQASNAILLFDEADALFGRRTEVQDAHDRYANVEIAHLLQLMEEYDGIAILATNLSQNFDDAFARRMQYLVEFPFPNERLRESIWRSVFPSEAPLSKSMDFSFLARRFELAGGSIKSAALSAAILAAASGSIEMEHVALGVAREYMKLGKLPSAYDFGPYFELVMSTLGADPR